MNKIALVTGSSRGIGRAVALALAEQGYDVGVNYNVHSAEATKVVDHIKKMGRRSLAFKANVGNVSEINSMFDQFFKEFGSIDLLINNAGVSIFAPFIQVTEELWNTVTNIDWKGTFFCTQRAAQKMIDLKKKGVILNVSSNQKDGCWPTASVYGPTKMAIAKFTKNAALELARYGIRVVAVAPGYTNVGWPKNDPIQQAKAKIPVKRFANPEEIAAVICRIASEEFSYMTGSCLDIDGGALLPVFTENDLDASWSSTNIS
jgi:NAD(P)-dependent dehydrogenase (short-subunit alcohol dehydrogenase family)